jgi:hypothetical protein
MWICDRCGWGNHGHQCERCANSMLSSVSTTLPRSASTTLPGSVSTTIPAPPIQGSNIIPLGKSPLRPDIPGSAATTDIRFHLDAAREAASEPGAGNAPITYDYGRQALERRARQLELLSVLTERDASHRTGVLDHLAALIQEAMLKNYDVTNDRIFRLLYSAAVALYSSSYQPMRVLGNTVEGMVKPK